MTKIKRRTWKDMGTPEKVGMVSFWVLIIVVGYWLLVGLSKPQQLTASSKFEPVKALTTYSSASEQALLSASQHISALDKAMADSAAILKQGQLQELGAQSRAFNVLADAGQNKFGNSVFEPLGQCYSAGLYARSWWQSQLSAANNAGVEKIPGSIRDASNSYQAARDQCLKSADPIAVAKADAELDADLRKKFGGGKECLRVFTYDAKTKETNEKPRPAHCTN
ncbi:hypothetical protein BLL42_23685 [Pseudomonas frederiksbergensis]|uniref:Uncharacterized protein n=1 Tax=Pseudomonas frederiksbergensis TaxID=104087 RepID=A0A1J0ERD3_9PSED|nr:hypothetical protein [Pseudomonas frederiksbergensis]APC18566.1 hypothetical protein BLL42_23685 [Pseudomonas frederiksbergensis]